MNLQQLKFPIGEYVSNTNISKALLNSWIQDIEGFPSKVEQLTENSTIAQLNWKYRPEGWTVKQVIHHCADSHMNSIIRFKLALTEERPKIRPYFEDRWAELTDSQDDNISDSITLLKGLHKKWVVLLRDLSEEALQREFIHPEHGKRFNLADNIGVYAWHCNHHLAHIKNGLMTNGKYN